MSKLIDGHWTRGGARSLGRWLCSAWICGFPLAVHGEDIGRLDLVFEHSRPVLSWANVAGQSYALEVASGPTTGQWERRVILTADADDVEWADDGLARETRFYRVALVSDGTAFTSLQQALQRACSNQGIVGAAAAVVFADGTEWSGTSGRSHGSVPIRPHTPFEVGSVTKTFVAATILRLVEEGVLSLEDNLGELLPSLDHPHLAKEITVRQLLNHRAGTYNFGDDTDFRIALFSDWSRRWTPEEILDFLKSPYFAPDAAGQYSNTGYVLLGMIIRSVTGSSVAAEIRRTVLERASLRSTFLGGEEDWVGELAHPHLDFDGDGIHEDLGGHSQMAILTGFWTSGAMVSTAGDVARFGAALFDGTLLTPASLAAMRMFQSLDIGGAYYDYGLGLMRFDILGREHWVHTGGLFGEYGWLSYCPSTGVSLGLAYNHPVTKATGPSLPGELLIALASLADSGAFLSSVPGALPSFPFLDSGKFLDDKEAAGSQRR
jgi:D-alanyl-D-alanine carboxypeptidase